MPISYISNRGKDQEEEDQIAYFSLNCFIICNLFCSFVA